MKERFLMALDGTRFDDFPKMEKCKNGKNH
jgi:hypothetical protein